MALTIQDRDALTTTFIIPTAVQNFLNTNPVWFRLHKKGQRFDGGRQIEQPIVNNKVTSGGAYRDRDSLVIANNQQVTSAVFQMQEYYVPISVSDRDVAINAGRAAVMEFAKLKVQNGRDTIADILGTAVQGSNASGIELDGLGLVLSAASTYGGIAVADVPTWIAKVAAAAANTMTVAGLQGILGGTTFGASRPTMMVAKQEAYDKFSTFGDTVQRIVDTDMASVGIAQLNFRGVPFVVDSHAPGTTPASNDFAVQFLNENYFTLWSSKQFNMKVEQMARIPTESVTRWNVWWKGNLVGSSRRHQGTLTSINPNL